MRWGKPTKNNKKHRDPRYFLTEGSDWPEDKTEDAMMGRARGLAQRGMENQISGERPPWEAEGQEEPGMGAFDGDIDGRSVQELLGSIRKALNIPGQTKNLEDFDLFLKSLNIELGPVEPHPTGPEESEAERRTSGVSDSDEKARNDYRAKREEWQRFGGPFGRGYDNK